MSLTDKIQSSLSRTLSDFKEQYGFNELGLAVSGGSDSLAMLYLCKEWAELNKVTLKCVTVDHQLRKEALMEAKTVAAHCSELGIKHDIVKWTHKDNFNGNLSDLARSALVSLGQTDAGCQTLAQVIMRFPDSDYSLEAEEIMSELQCP